MQLIQFSVQLGIGGMIGIVVGVMLVFWIEPTTNGGIAFIIALCALVGAIVSAGVKALFRR